MRLKNFQEENKFPEKIVPNFYKEMRNQLGRLSNPYDPNPYGPGKINNLFGQSQGNNYSYGIGTKIGPWNDFNFYMKNSNLGGNIENRDNPYALSFSNSSRRNPYDTRDIIPNRSHEPSFNNMPIDTRNINSNPNVNGRNNSQRNLAENNFGNKNIQGGKYGDNNKRNP